MQTYRLDEPSVYEGLVGSSVEQNARGLMRIWEILVSEAFKGHLTP